MSSRRVAFMGLLLGVWLLLAGQVNAQSIIIGLFLVAFTYQIFRYMAERYIFLQHGSLKVLKLSPLTISAIITRLGWLLVFMPYFMYEIMVSALTVTKTVIFPNLIRPGIIRYQTKLTNPFAIAILANLVNLTPGTIVMDIDTNNNMYIHCLHLSNNDPKREIIASTAVLENWVRRIFT